MNTRDAFRNLKVMAGDTRAGESARSNTLPDAIDLNTFYTRFDRKKLYIRVHKASGNHPPYPRMIIISKNDVTWQFKRTSIGKTAGPESISAHFLYTCAEELAPMFTQLFQESVDTGIIPNIWNTSTVIPELNIRSPHELNQYIPVVLTSVPMKAS